MTLLEFVCGATEPEKCMFVSRHVMLMHARASAHRPPHSRSFHCLPAEPLHCSRCDMSVSTSPIRLRDTPAELQAKLNLTGPRFDNFKNFARRAHNEYIQTHPTSRWANVNVVWTALPEQERLETSRIMYDLCKAASLFPAGYPQSRIKEGIEARLHQVRRTWQQGKRENQRQHAEDD